MSTPTPASVGEALLLRDYTALTAAVAELCTGGCTSTTTTATTTSNDNDTQSVCSVCTCDSLASQVASAACALAVGQPLSVFDAPFAAELLNLPVADAVSETGMKETCMLVNMTVANYLSAAGDNREWSELGAVCVGAACLEVFIQANWTGPTVKNAPPSPFPPVAALVTSEDVESAMNERVIETLSSDGEPAYIHMHFPHYLVAARAFLSETEGIDNTPSAYVWRARAVLAHQRTLNDPAHSLSVKMRESYAQALATYASAFKVTAARRVTNTPTTEGTVVVGAFNPDVEPGTLESEGESENTLPPGTPIDLDPSLVPNYLAARVCLEAAIGESTYNATDAFRILVDRAIAASGLDYKLTGAMGVRTKYQKFKHAQLIVHATSAGVDRFYAPGAEEADAGQTTDNNEAEPTATNGKESENAAPPAPANESSSAASANESSPAADVKGKGDGVGEGEGEGEGESESVTRDPSAWPEPLHTEEEIVEGPHVPPNIKNENEVLLQRTKFDEEQPGQDELAVPDQCIVLSLCHDVENNNPAHGLTTEEMAPYIARVVDNPCNWTVHSMALWQRSRLELQKSKTRERAALQMQALIEQYECDDDQTPFSVRAAYFYYVDYPCRWEMKREVGLVLMNMGVVRTARILFEELDMYEEIVKCYIVEDKNKKAIQILRERIEIKPTPSMLLLLGQLLPDAKDKEDAFRQSWELSGGHFAAVQRSWGRLCDREQRWEECIEHYKAALAINPLFPMIWFSLGAAAMRMEEWEMGLDAFKHAVNIDRDDAMSWANMGGIFLRLSRKKEAYNSLTEAVRYAPNNWKIWENYILVSMDTGNWQSAARGVVRVSQITEGKRIDTEVLHMLVQVYTDYFTERHPNLPGLGQQLEQAFYTVTSITTRNPEVWKAFVAFLRVSGDKREAVKCLERRCRACQTPRWNKTAAEFKEVAEATLDLVAAYEEEGSDEMLLKAANYLRSIVSQSQMYFSDLDLWKQMKSKMKTLPTPSAEADTSGEASRV